MWLSGKPQTQTMGINGIVNINRAGWEQGGFATAGQYNNGTVINLPVTMANTNYTVLVAPKSNTHWTDNAMYNRNGTSQIIIYAGYNGNSGQNGEVCWEVKGMAA